MIIILSTYTTNKILFSSCICQNTEWMVQSCGLDRRFGGHRDKSVSASPIGFGRYAQNAT